MAQPLHHFHGETSSVVLKQGLLCLAEHLSISSTTSTSSSSTSPPGTNTTLPNTTSPSEQELFTFPKRRDGSSLLLRKNWYEKVLRGQVKLENCPPADVSAAQGDLKHLSFAQLLKVGMILIMMFISGDRV